MSRHAIWVDAEGGDDDNGGTVTEPVRTFVRAMQERRRLNLLARPVDHGIRIILRHGDYTLDEEGLFLLQTGDVLAAEGLVRVNGSTLSVRPTRQTARSHA